MTFETLELVLGLTEPRKVLIIEDNISFVSRLRLFLERKGHTVHSYTGVEQQGSCLLGLEPDRISDPDEIVPNHYDVCFLDHYFAGSDFNGSTFLGLLMNHPVRVCGMSSVDTANDSMRRCGALTSIRKDRLDQLLTL
jgi:CheY-like chemotaxis protein